MAETFSFADWAKDKKLAVLDSNSIQSHIQDLQKKANKFYFRGSILTARKKLNLETLRQNARVKPENLLEIIQTAANEHLYNQFAFGPGTKTGPNRRIAADMIELASDNYTIKSIIELKTNQTGSSGDFYWACYEVIYYYFLLCHATDEQTTQPPARTFRQRYRLDPQLRLIVLAPESFFDKDFQVAFNEVLRQCNVNASLCFYPIPAIFIAQYEAIKDAVCQYETWKHKLMFIPHN